MPKYDIGIDLGTTNVIIYDPQGNLLLKEPSVVAYNVHTNKVVAVGQAACDMLGRTPEKIMATMPLSDGVISDFDMTSEMITRFIKKIYAGKLIKPRVIVCVPGGITEVESDAVVSAATTAGARKVYLIEEPVAAAIGAGIDISLPQGIAVMDMGGGTSDAAVLSFNGVVCKSSVKVAGRKLDESIARHVKNKYNLLIGDKMAELAKIAVASALPDDDDDASFTVKGRNLITGLPGTQVVTRKEISEAISDNIEQIVSAVKRILEMTPPELASDIYTTGLVLTGGTALLHNLSLKIEKEVKIPVRLAENPIDCVAIGTARAFNFLDGLYDGFVQRTTYKY